MDNNQNQRNNNNNPLGGGGGNSPRRQNLILLLVAALVTMFLMTYFLRAFSENTNSEVSYSDFIKKVEAGEIEKIVIEEDRINIYPKETKAEDQLGFGYSLTGYTTVTYYTGKAEEDSVLTQRMLDAGVEVSSEVPDSSGAILTFLLYYIAPILLMWLLLSIIFKRMGRGGGPLSVGKSNAKVYVQKETGVTFKDVAGEDEAKESLVEVVDFLHNPSKYAKIGAKLPKGALLVGPPGTGKTLLAKAVAGEAHVPFFSLAGSDFIELYVGVGASRVRDLFSEASKNAPCIIFIDEIDAIGRSRDSKYGGGNEEREQTLNQLLSEMDGFDSSKGVLILGATNRPEILDKALLRPGRFDRRIIVDKPDLKGREEILKVHSKDVKMDETVDLKAIALATSGAVGSDLANMINEAAINAVKAHREYVCQQDLMEAVEQVLVGKEKKDRILSKAERKIVSYHEVGHALISAVQKNTEPVQKITIVPRTMGALGYVMQVPEDEKFLQTKDEIIDDIIVTLGGRAAEEVIFNTVTTGAENDIEKATSMARSMITMFGMSDKFGLMQLESIQNRYLDGNRVLNCSDQTAAEVDAEVKKLLAECYDKAKKIISEHLDAMDKIAQFLIEEETITGKEFMKIYREVENLPEPTEEEQEKAKEGRIYATRAESAMVGENVPIKKPKKEEPVIEQPAESSYGAANEQPVSAEPAVQDFREVVEEPEAQDKETSEPVQSQGLFSHVPEDFDKKD
ncbi:ATP-dependent zinc metalloprotease FtsH [Butyrivibrio sp. XPD2006]|jgi:cell division protease FtsH|uniref:ATP-dependent zinc metalloprotease FtsH n=1 Tax=Butyrivibrio sp. XPD2006 TaxID=1280668 RepID=UPI0003B753A0|nr:ATP-dependent zinc metalloprotease FtsH [Butyrivibrio sp. XPD2006]